MISSISKKWWFKWLLVGVLIRLILMPITFHPDLWGHSSVAYFFAYQGEVNIYEYLAKLPSEHPLVKSMGVADIFIYPPLTYFTLGVFRLLVKPFADPNFMPMIWQGFPQALTYPNLHWHLFLYKLPYLFVDILTAFVFAALFDAKKKKLAFAFWIFNPLSLYATFMVGQLDLLPTLFTILALYFFQKKKFLWAAFSLGLGAGYKFFPLLLLLPLAFLSSKELKERVKVFLIGIATFVASILPFLGSPAFRQMVLFSPKSQKVLFMGLNVSGAEVIYPFVLLLAFIYLHAYYAKKKLELEGYFLTILLLIFAVTHYHPQWFLWASPFLFLHLINKNMKYLALSISLFASWFFLTLLFESSLSYGLFSPIFPELKDAPNLDVIMGKYTNIFQLKSLIRSYFAGASLFLVYNLFKRSSASSTT